MKRVFISYAHEDVASRDALVVHLGVLRTASIIESWHDGELRPGEDWKATIDRQLKAADIVILLVSASFLASKSCQELELDPALNRWKTNDVLIIPVIVRACHWELSPIAQLQVLPSQGKPVATWAHQDDAWTEVTKKISSAATRTADGATSQSPARVSNSTKGSAAFIHLDVHQPRPAPSIALNNGETSFSPAEQLKSELIARAFGAIQCVAAIGLYLINQALLRFTLIYIPYTIVGGPLLFGGAFMLLTGHSRMATSGAGTPLWVRIGTPLSYAIGLAVGFALRSLDH